MTDTQALKDLLVRVEDATEPDRELDAAIAVVLFKSTSGPEWGEFAKLPHPNYDSCAAGTYWLCSRSGDSLRTSPEISGSVDSALAFMEEHFTGYVIMKHDLTYSSAEICRRRGYGQDICCGFNERPDEYLPLAIIAATLKALIEEKADG